MAAAFVPSTFADCFEGCKTNATCNHWMYDWETLNCTHHAIAKYNSYVQLAAVVTGEKFCAGEGKND